MVAIVPEAETFIRHPREESGLLGRGGHVVPLEGGDEELDERRAGGGAFVRVGGSGAGDG